MKKYSPLEISSVVQLLRKGEIVALPTETVYGLAGNAFSEAACARIFQAKERPTFDPLIVHTEPLKTRDAVGELESRRLIRAAGLTPAARTTLQNCSDAFWPGPLTLVLPKHPDIPDLVSSGLPTVGIRVPAHPLFQEVLRALQLPLAAPSANRFGRISPVTADQVVQELEGRIAGVLNGGTSAVGVESTILRILEDGSVEVLRPGGTPLEKIRDRLGVAVRASSAREGTPPVATAPGMLESHYAPTQVLYRLPVRWDKVPGASPALLNQIRKLSENARTVLILSPDRELDCVFDPATVSGIFGSRPVRFFSLSPSANDLEAAARLFTVLREMDQSPGVLLLVEPAASSHGLYWAIQDRLKRASQPLDD